MKIWVSTDLHLYSVEPDERHPFRTRRNLGLMSDNFASDISQEDVWIFLGDLCDPEAADKDQVRKVIQSIPCRKYMCRGNHDTEDDVYYLELGFFDVGDIIRYHNIIFSHKPCYVAPDEVNIHGHLHTQVLSNLGPNHINAYASNWNDGEHPVLLEDLIDSAIVQDLAITQMEQSKIQTQYEKYTSLFGDTYSRFLDITDVIDALDTPQLITEAVNKEQSITDPVLLYHGSNSKFKVLKAFPSPAYPDQARVFATPSYKFALAFAGKQWSDLEINQCMVNGEHVLTEILPGMFKEKFECPGYVHILEPDGFEPFGRAMEWVCPHDVTVSKVDRINNVLAEMKHQGVKLYTYPNLPTHIQSREIYIRNIINKYNMDTTYEMLRDRYSLTETANCGQDDMDMLSEILFQDSEDTKYWMADSEDYPRKVEKAKEQKGNTAVTIDEGALKILDAQDIINEALIGSEPDIEMNLKEWKPKGKNFLYICGLSASGKTTQANAMAKQYGVEVIHLDDLAQAAFVGKMANPNYRNQMSPTMQEYWDSTTNHITMYRWGDQRIGLETDKFIKWLITNHESDGKRYIIEGCEIWYIDPDYLIHQPLIIKGTSAMKTVAWRFKRTYGQHLEKGETPLQAFTHCLKQLATILKNGSMIAAENTLQSFRNVLKAAQAYEEQMQVTNEATIKQYPTITAKTKKSSNPNDGVSSKAVRVTFFNHRKEEIGMAAASAVDTDTAFLYDVEVYPAYRGKGYGNSIMQYMMDNYPITELTVEKSNKVAISLYKKFGFKKTMDFKENGKDMIDMKTMVAMTESVDDTVDHTLTKNDKTKLAKKYGLTDVGNDHEYDDEKELAEMKRKEADRKAKKALDGKKKARDKQLKNARSAKKRKAFFDKVKSSLPGVKKEEASAVDNDDIDWTDGGEYFFRSHTDQKKFIQESYSFQLVDRVQFMDRLDEAAQKNPKYQPVYIVIMHTGTVLANTIKTAIGSMYSHASISFDSSLRNMYSFARKLADDGKSSRDGGFRKEDITNPFFKDKEIKFSMYMVPCTADQIKLMQKRLDYFQKNQSKFTYDFTGLVKNFFHISDNPEYKWFCTRFVADILNSGRPNDPYIQDPFLVRPDDFMKTNFAMFVTSGYLDKYDQKEVDKTTKRLLNQKKVQQFVEDSQNEMALDLPYGNPYERHILNFQLSKMDEAAVDNFLMYLKSFKVRFDANGDIRITRREFDQLDAHFRSSLKLIKACEEAGNVEGVKEELYKIHYMIELINQYYLKPYAKNYRPNTKEVRKDMMDLRSVMMNAFKQHLEWVTLREPRYNFQRGYQVSTYGSETKIPHKVITHVGKTITTMLV